LHAMSLITLVKARKRTIQRNKSIWSMHRGNNWKWDRTSNEPEKNACCYRMLFVPENNSINRVSKIIKAFPDLKSKVLNETFRSKQELTNDNQTVWFLPVEIRPNCTGIMLDRIIIRLRNKTITTFDWTDWRKVPTLSGRVTRVKRRAIGLPVQLI
jgi:hypothetical protein